MRPKQAKLHSKGLRNRSQLRLFPFSIPEQLALPDRMKGGPVPPTRLSICLRYAVAQHQTPFGIPDLMACKQSSENLLKCSSLAEQRDTQVAEDFGG